MGNVPPTGEEHSSKSAFDKVTSKTAQRAAVNGPPNLRHYDADSMDVDHDATNAYAQQQMNPGAHPQQQQQQFQFGHQVHHHHHQQQQQQQHEHHHHQQHSDSSAAAPLSPEASSDDTIPTVFRWEHGGTNVFVTGTFNGWSKQIPMHRSGNDFTYIHNLKKGKHAFKFIVDDEWRFAPDQPTVADVDGRINNFIDVSDFVPFHGDKDFEQKTQGGASSADILGDSSSHHSLDNEAKYTTKMPDLDEYTKEPPPLPPHLRHIILNKAPQLSDTASLPIPKHVALNHLYCTAIKDNMMVLGITQRHKTKFVTTVYYSPSK